MSDYEQLNNKPELKPYRRNLRNGGTSAEATLWKHLQHSKLEGRKFRRQHSFGHYILDFYCPTERLCVELDGAAHFTEEGMAKDEARTAYLNSMNIRVVRFENKCVFDDINFVLNEIKKTFLTTPD